MTLTNRCLSSSSNLDMNFPTFFFFPSSQLSAILQKTCYSCYLAADVIVLVTVLANLLTMRRHAIHLKKSISKLSWTFLIVSAVSTAILIVEIILTFPVSTSPLRFEPQKVVLPILTTPPSPFILIRFSRTTMRLQSFTTTS